MSPYPQAAEAGGTRARRPSEAGSAERGVAKRSSNACERCRRQKIRCSGRHPCDACERRNLPCRLNDGDQKIMVAKGYIEALQRKAAALERTEGARVSTLSDARNASADRGDGGEDDSALSSVSREGEPSFDQGGHSPPRQAESEEGLGSRSDPEGATLTNPMSTGPSNFMTAGDGVPHYLGTSSNWSFTRRILSMTHEHLFQTPLPAQDLIFDGHAYELDWNGSRSTPGPETPVMPTLDHALFLINAVKFHCGQVFHLFDEDTFMSSLYAFYDDFELPKRTLADELWYVHFLVVLAFGKAFIGKNPRGKSPSGSEFFSKAVHLLPSMVTLWRYPVHSTEVLCCIALYLHSLDYRMSAHNYIGQAIRLAIGYGLHTDMPVERLGQPLVERSRRAWWTAYILDREMTSLMGVPQAIHDDDMHSQLPTFSGSVQRTAACSIRIKLSQIIARINRTVYGKDGKLDSKFFGSTKDALAKIAEVADELQRCFPMCLESSVSGLSRTSAHLHLLYNQCIVLATRPLLFCFLKIRLESAEACSAKLNGSGTVRSLIQMCVDSSLQMIRILDSLRTQGLLELFLPFDLDSLFISTASLTVRRVLDPWSLESSSRCFEAAYTAFDELVAGGNHVAELLKSELLQLDEMLGSLIPGRPSLDAYGLSTTGAHAVFPISATAVPEQALPTPNTAAAATADEINYGTLMSSAQIREMSESIGALDTEWMSQTMLDYSIW